MYDYFIQNEKFKFLENRIQWKNIITLKKYRHNVIQNFTKI